MNKEEQVILGFGDMLNKMVWLNNHKMRDSLRGFRSSEVHCIEYIGSSEDPNVTKLAESLYMTRGAICKITKKLMKKGVIESYQKPENKKEIYFRLTKQGKAIHKVHDEMHREFQERDRAVFEQFSERQYATMLSFVDKYSRHLDAEIERQGVDMRNRSIFE